MSAEFTIVRTKTIVNWWSLDQAVWAFRDELEGPLRTRPEIEAGEGGCAAINPRWDPPRRDWWRGPRWRRHDIATLRRYDRERAIGRRAG